jgi:hypothetical protein
MNDLSFKPIDYHEWAKGDYRPIAVLRYSSDELAKRHAIDFKEYWQDGLGQTKEARFITSSGKQFLLVHYLDAPAPYHSMTHIFSLFDIASMTGDLEDILEALGFASEELNWVEPNISFQKYEVWRQDDNGNKFLIDIAPSKPDAKKIMLKYERLPHKQTFWMERYKG